MTRIISQKFRFFSFFAIAMLAFVHGYNLQETYLRPFSPVNEPMTFTTWTEYFFANGILRFRIPILFIISGYIFAQQDNKVYGERIKKRFVTLVIPLLFWSAAGLAFTYLLQQFPFTAKVVADAGIDQLGDNRPYNEIGWGGMFVRWLLAPASFQLWFIRVLFIYNLAYPFFKWVVKKYPLPWFIIAFTAFFINLNVFYFIEGQGLLFFSLGIWLNKTNFSMERQPRWFSLPLAWLFFIGCSVIKTFMAFELEPYHPASIWVLSILYTSSIVAGIMAVWYGLDNVVRWCMAKKWFVKGASFSFIIYAMHVPLLCYITRLYFIALHDIPCYRILTYILAPLTTILICVATGALLRRFLPRIYKVITGGRGF
jgi:fucose 4-O-acetylase-like acetyltransferase